MLIELHMIQNFAPANLNRDDTGAPKDCDFGGVRRARVSSQCFKRAIREEFKRSGVLEQEQLAERTKILVNKVVDVLKQEGKEEEQSKAIVAAALGGAGLSVKDDGKTEYLLFVGRTAVESLAKICLEHWDTFAAIISEASTEDTSKKKKKQSAKSAVPKEVGAAVLEILDSARAADLALFGRMLADLPKQNIDAASQVAHAISTHKVSMEFDFYTAVDDLQPREETGAGMMGTVEFNSACFYRYANVDVDQLKKNLGGDDGAEELARKTIDTFIRASKDALPTGKQNSFAAHNPPAFILAVVRKNGHPVSLANAFEKPVSPGRKEGLIGPSIEALDKYWADFTAMYGNEDIKMHVSSRMGEKPELKGLGLNEEKIVTFDKLVKSVMESIEFKKEA